MRKSGILMHISSLPGPWGIGTMGKSAYEFVDFLKAAGQSYWQILPLSPTGYGDSPYQAFSTFAGNHYFIDPGLLVEEGLLTQEEAEGTDAPRVDYGALYARRLPLLRRAFARFRPDAGYRQFLLENEDWLEDYAIFMTLKEKTGGRDWQHWSYSVMIRLPEALAGCRAVFKEELEFQYFLQYEFFRQWKALRRYAGSRGIQIIGDVPIYVPLDSADVWASPWLFALDAGRRPRAVAGCPPDAFSADGQLWGNPLYDWEKMKATGYRWWIRRLEACARLYDVVRLDHFRGFESYWSVPAGAGTAAAGHWEKGPGMDFLKAVREALPGLSCIAEDLGYVTEEVRALQEESGYPGMKVLQFAFDSREQGDYLPHTYPVQSVCYTGTHDNLTLRQWLEEADPGDVARARAYLGLNAEEGPVSGMIRGCLSSVSRLAVIQMQDWLELGGQARMNCPGTLSSRNWTWRAGASDFTPELAEKIRSATERYGRL